MVCAKAPSSFLLHVYTPDFLPQPSFLLSPSPFSALTPASPREQRRGDCSRNYLWWEVIRFRATSVRHAMVCTPHPPRTVNFPSPHSSAIKQRPRPNFVEPRAFVSWETCRGRDCTLAIQVVCFICPSPPPKKKASLLPDLICGSPNVAKVAF